LPAERSTPADALPGFLTVFHTRPRIALGKVAGAVFLPMGGLDVGSRHGIDTAASASRKSSKIRHFSLNGVEQLEMIDIDHHQRQRFAALDGVLPRALERALEAAPVGEPGEAVEARERVEV
jgi:hypothetical protein